MVQEIKIAERERGEVEEEEHYGKGCTNSEGKLEGGGIEAVREEKRSIRERLRR